MGAVNRLKEGMAMIPLRQREKYKVVLGMVLAGLASYADGSMEWSMWWIVNGLGVFLAD